ncbi:MAG: tripartite tricarboxylate transporter substrate binding protein [Roseomonas sp.]|nr:tripartite tricarboxylate transporter substrate binding protein [Roseomonas sp.]
MSESRYSRRAILAGTSLLAMPGIARAQAGDWPRRAVRYINPFPAGGSTDVLSRIYCARMTEITGQSFVVENRAGAGGNVGVDAIAKSAPDGYTIGMGGIASHAIAPTLYSSLNFDPEKDFTFITGLWQLPNLLGVNLDLPARSVPELIALLKANPGRYSFGSAGSGTTLHLSGEMFKQLAGVNMEHVPYRGAAPGLVDLMAGRIHMMFDNMPSMLALARQGKVRALAVTSEKRSPIEPDLPAIAEFLPGFDVISWTCLCTPAGLPRDIADWMSHFSKQALEHPDLVRSFREQGATAWFTSMAEISAFRAAQQAKLAPVIRTSGARVD